MTPNRVQVAIEKYGDKIPAKNHDAFRTALKGASNECMDTFMFLPTKSPIATLLFSIFLGQFGVDRFYIGDVGYGLLKIFGPMVLGFINAIILMIVPPLGILTSLALYLIIFIWFVMEIFMAYRDCKRLNYDRLVSFLGAHREEEASYYSYSESKKVSKPENIDTTSYEQYEASKGEYSPLVSPYKPVAAGSESTASFTQQNVAQQPTPQASAPQQEQAPQSLNIIFTCPVCGQKMRISTVASKYCCPSCMTIYPYQNVVKNQ